MKGILCACLLASLQSVVQAYEANIHYSTTYVLARAVGWPQAEALTIASANQGVDENQGTVAALEMDSTPGPAIAGYLMSSLHQAEKNLRFHCFSRMPGVAGRISADVREVMSGRFADAIARGDDPRGNARTLIALGVALHCQQDAYSHLGFGGSCGSYPGSCYGHTYQTFLDQVVFGLLGKHYYNPDHPGVSGQWLLEALRGSARELSARRPQSSRSAIPANALIALSEALRESGLDLPDEVRRDANRYIAGKWLFDLLHSGSRRQNVADRLERLTPDVAGTCRNAALGSATIVWIPAPRYPRLNADASPSLVRADGTYQQLQGGEAAESSAVSDARRIARRAPDYDPHAVKLQLSHWRQLLALPPTAHVALPSARSERQAR